MGLDGCGICFGSLELAIQGRMLKVSDESESHGR